MQFLLIVSDHWVLLLILSPEEYRHSRETTSLARGIAAFWRSRRSRLGNNNTFGGDRRRRRLLLRSVGFRRPTAGLLKLRLLPGGFPGALGGEDPEVSPPELPEDDRERRI